MNPLTPLTCSTVSVHVLSEHTDSAMPARLSEKKAGSVSEDPCSKQHWIMIKLGVCALVPAPHSIIAFIAWGVCAVSAGTYVFLVS